MKWSWRLGRFAGINVHVHATFFILVAWLAVTEWSQTHSTGTVVGAVLFILALFGCVVIHEFGHAFAARHFGIPTRDITLLPIGGVSRLERIPDKPREEFWVALTGPLVSLAVAGALWLFLWVVHAPTTISQVAQLPSGSGIYPFLAQLMVANGVLAVFNLLPAFPMDGGRIFRAFLARWMDHARATHIAARVGQGMASLFAVAGIFGNPFLLLIALFIWIGAGQEAASAEIKSVLTGIPVSQVTVTDFKTISPSDALAHPVELLLHGGQQDFPVIEDGRLVGVLTRKDLLRGIARGGLESLVAETMRPGCPVVQSSETLENALSKCQELDCTVLPVVDRDRLLGIFSVENLGEFVMVQSALAKGKKKTGESTQLAA